jgi:hypothetical protein
MNRLRLFLAALSTALAFVALGLAPATTSTAATVVINSFVFASSEPTSADTDVQDWIDRIYTDGGTVSQAAVDAVEDFVTEAKADGYWTTFRRLNLFVGDSIAYLHPLVNTSGAAEDAASGAGITYAESTGPVTDGASYIDTGYTPTETTGGLSAYLRTSQTSDTNARVPIGCRAADSANHFRIGLNTAGNGSGSASGYRGIWGGTHVSGNSTGGTSAPNAGMLHVTRASTTDLQLFRTATQVGTTQTTSVTAATPSQAIYVFSNNSGGTAALFLEASSALGAYAIDTGMSAAQVALYNTDMQAFQTAMGRAI